MRAVLLVAAVLSAFALFALAPPASACAVTQSCNVSKYGYCVEGTAPCASGMLVCATIDGRAAACAPDPCADANCFNLAIALPDGAATTSTGACGTVPVLHGSVCVRPDEPSSIECAYLNAGQLACVPDPCGTTDCF
jgi:hypothetical protein